MGFICVAMKNKDASKVTGMIKIYRIQMETVQMLDDDAKGSVQGLLFHSSLKMILVLVMWGILLL